MCTCIKALISQQVFSEQGERTPAASIAGSYEHTHVHTFVHPTWLAKTRTARAAAALSIHWRRAAARSINHFSLVSPFYRQTGDEHDRLLEKRGDTRTCKNRQADLWIACKVRDDALSHLIHGNTFLYDHLMGKQ
jgi:hypothetical protein